MNRLKGKRAFLTAAGAGIGRATAEAFAAEGAEVIATDLKLDLIADLNTKGIAEVHTLDVRDTAAVNALAAKVGPVDILFNCAGFVHHGTALTTSDADWDFSFDINVKAMHRTIAAFLPGMLERGGGSIVNVSSVMARQPSAANVDYGAAKAALAHLTKSLAEEFGPQGVRVNSITPGPVRTPWWTDAGGAADIFAAATGTDRDHVLDSGAAEMMQLVTGRLIEPEEIADAVLLLASPRSASTIGAEFVVDGGMLKAA
jgi:2-keto-3-deoxy-L-fuconate dehydrogenase